MEASQRQRIEQYCNKQFYEALQSNKRLKIFQGGSRSGKTYSLMQYVLYLITTSEEPLVISIIRKTLPALKRSVLRDFLKISKDIGIYWEGVFNKAENTFEYNGHRLLFFSADDQQKIRGVSHDIAWLNIPVNHATSVSVGQGIGYFQHNARRGRQRHGLSLT